MRYNTKREIQNYNKNKKKLQWMLWIFNFSESVLRDQMKA